MFLKVGFGLFIFSVSSILFAQGNSMGGHDGGGGMGIVCKNLDGTIKSVELLDLWEARVIYSRKPITSNESVENQIEHHLQNLKNSVYAAEMCVGNGVGHNYCDGVQGPEALYQELKFGTDRFLNTNLPQIHRLRGARLKKTDDSFEVVTPSNCEIEQLVRYKDTANGGDILINQDLVDYMDNVNEAALYLHEAFYAFLRPAEKSSIRVRRAIGLSFFGHRFKTLESFLPKEYYDCQSTTSLDRVFVYVPDSGMCANEGVTFQIVNVAGMQVLDFEEPDMCQHGNLEDVFNSQSPIQSWRPLGRKVGFDYSMFLSIGGANGAKQATLVLQGAPDQPSTKKVTLDCQLKTN